MTVRAELQLETEQVSALYEGMKNRPSADLKSGLEGETLKVH